MATHTPAFRRAGTLPVEAILGSIPSWPRPIIERLVVRLIDHLDEQDGDTDAEGDPFNEGEPAFDPQSRALVGAFPNCDPDCEAEFAWTERLDQSQHPYGGHEPAMLLAHEDAEDDDPGGGAVDDEGEREDWI